MRILVCDGVAQEAIDLLRTKHEVTEDTPSPEYLVHMIREYDAVIVRSRTKLPLKILEGTKLKAIGRAGIGTDNIDTEAATVLGIPVLNAPSGSTTSVAELTLGLMLGLARHIPKADATMKDGEWAKKSLKGTELSGKTLGLIGSGRIGSAVANLCQAFGMDVLVYDPYLSDEQIASFGGKKVELDNVLVWSDYISLHLPINDETRGMISTEQLIKMKDTAYIVNCARGGIIDEEALVKALNDELIAGAALDVFAEEPPKGEILKVKNLIMTPHIAAATAEGQNRAGTIVAEQVMKVLDGERPDFLVNKALYSKWPEE